MKQRLTVAAEQVSVTNLDSGRLHEHASALEKALQDTRSASDNATLDRAVGDRMKQIMALPVTPPAPGPPGWIGVRVVGTDPDTKTTVPLPGVRLQVSDSTGNPIETTTGPEGIGYLELPPDMTTYTVEAVAPDDEIVGAINGSRAGSMVHLLQLEHQSSLWLSFKGGEHWLYAAKAADSAVKTLTDRAAAELASQEHELVSRLEQVSQVI
jgi:hypothetical protein